MYILGITGLMASGKSTVCHMLKASYRVPVFDADKRVHALLNQETIQKKLITIFPALPQNFHRHDLATLLQDNSKNIEKLTGFLYPLLEAQLKVFIKQHKRLGVRALALDVPLLFEAGWDKYCTHTILVKVSKHAWKARLLRRGYGEKDQAWRLQGQMSDKRKLRLATYSLDTSLGYRYTFEQIQVFFQLLWNPSCVRSSSIQKQQALAFRRATVLWKSGVLS